MCIIIDSIIQTLFGLDTPWWLQVLLACSALLLFAAVNVSVFIWMAGNEDLIRESFSKNADKTERPPYFSYKKAWRSLLKADGKNETPAALSDAAPARLSESRRLWETAFFIFSLLSLTPLAWGSTHCNLPSPVSCSLTDSPYGAYMAVAFLIASAFCALRCPAAANPPDSPAQLLKRTAGLFIIFALMLLSMACPVILNSSASLSDFTAGQSFNCFYLSVFGLNIFPAAAGAVIYVFCFKNLSNMIFGSEAPFGRLASSDAESAGTAIDPLFKTASALFLFSGSALFAGAFLGGSNLPGCSYPIVCNAGFLMIFYTDLWLGMGVFIFKAYTAALLFLHFCIYRDNADIGERLESFVVKNLYPLIVINIAAGFIFILVLKLYFGG